MNDYTINSETEENWLVNAVLPVMPIPLYAIFLQWLSRLGHDINPLLASARIPIKHLHKPTVQISWQQVRTLILEAYKVTNCSSLGLLFGQKLTLNELGNVGIIANGAGNLNAAIQTLHKYQQLVFPHSRLELDIAGNTAILRLNLLFSGRINTRFFCECWATALLNSTKLLLTENQLQKISFCYPAPSYVEHYYSALPVAIEFDQPAFAIYFDRAALDYAMPMQIDTHICELARKQCNKLTNISNQYRKVIQIARSALLESTKSLPGLSTIAQQLGTTPRTLARNLGMLGTSYNSVIEDLRIDLAIYYLRNSDMLIEEVSAKLGYADPSNFRKVFRKRLGVSPSEYRISLGTRGL